MQIEERIGNLSFISPFLQRRYQNRPIVEFELAAQEQMKVTEFRLSKLFTVNSATVSQIQTKNAADVTKAGGDFASDRLFLFIIFTFCWSMVFLVSSHVFQFSNSDVDSIKLEVAL